MCKVVRAISVCRREAMALKEENHAVVEARAEALALCLNEGVLTYAKLGGFNSYCGMLCATRMLTSFLFMLLSWSDVRVATEVGRSAKEAKAATAEEVGISTYHGISLVAPWASIANTAISFIMFIYIIVPLFYWYFNTFDACRFPSFSN
jgi:hypothetical protein